MADAVRINLLPHREQKRQARQRQFVSFAVLLAILALAVVGLVHMIFAAKIDDQNARNKLLKTEIAKLDDQIQRDRQAARPDPAGAGAQAGGRDAAVQPQRGGAPARPDRPPAARRHLPQVDQAGRQTASRWSATRRSQRAGLDADAQHRGVALGRPRPSWSRSSWSRCPGATRSAAAQQVNEFTLNFQVKRAQPSSTVAPAPVRAGESRSQGMNFDDLRRLSLRDVGNWPILPKVLMLGAGGRGDRRRRRLPRLEGPVRDARSRAGRRADAARAVRRRRRPRRSTSTPTARSSPRSSSRSARWSSSCPTAPRSTRS